MPYPEMWANDLATLQFWKESFKNYNLSSQNIWKQAGTLDQVTKFNSLNFFVWGFQDDRDEELNKSH